MVTNIKKWWIGDRDIHAKHDNRAGFVTTVKFTDKGCIGIRVRGLQVSMQAPLAVPSNNPAQRGQFTI